MTGVRGGGGAATDAPQTIQLNTLHTNRREIMMIKKQRLIHLFRAECGKVKAQINETL